jgi:hypothetical protein
MSRSSETRKPKQEAELLRAIAVEKGVISRRLDQAAWARISRVMNLPITTCR